MSNSLNAVNCVSQCHVCASMDECITKSSNEYRLAAEKVLMKRLRKPLSRTQRAGIESALQGFYHNSGPYPKGPTTEV